MSPAPDISFVIPVYNKADILPEVIRTLAAQQVDASLEYLFVDDASTDASLSVLHGLAASLPSVTIIENSSNKGPSLRLNQGAALATGRYLCLIDADELIAPDAVAVMNRLMRQSGAQMVHGKVSATDSPAHGFTPPAVGDTQDFSVFDAPLATVAEGRGFVRMSWLVETALFRAAGGCDPRIFIQDEALPLRLARAARRMVDLRATTCFAPAAASHLSSGHAQQHHDRFFAAYNFLSDSADLSSAIRTALTRKCLSAAWKAVRGGFLNEDRASIFFGYLGTKFGFWDLPQHELHRIARSFARVNGIRRTVPGSAKAGE